jgi:prephenate dehydratase
VEDADQIVCFAGEEGSFAEDAAIAFFGEAPRAPVPAFRDVFEQVTSADAHWGVLPIENLVNGTVREVYDLLLEHTLAIHGEVIVPVNLCLAALPGQKLEAIERVYSHIQALGQAEAFLRSRPWELLTTYNTAGAGKRIAERAEKKAAAVLSSRAAALFGLPVLADRIQTEPDNRTRFLVVGPEGATVPARTRTTPPSPKPGAARAARAAAAPAPIPQMRTTLVLAVRNQPGALHRCLGVFASAGLNLSKLESRPSHDAPWEYVFWIDLDADVRASATRVALAELGGIAAMVRVLGSYPRGTDP